jgi:hypothetical protein
MSPSTSSQHVTRSSPPQDTTLPSKRSLRSRTSNPTMSGNSTVGSGDTERDGGGGGGKHSSDDGGLVVNSGGDARGNFSQLFPPLLLLPEKSKFPLR